MSSAAKWKSGQVKLLEIRGDAPLPDSVFEAFKWLPRELGELHETILQLATLSVYPYSRALRFLDKAGKALSAEWVALERDPPDRWIRQSYASHIELFIENDDGNDLPLAGFRGLANEWAWRIRRPPPFPGQVHSSAPDLRRMAVRLMEQIELGLRYPDQQLTQAGLGDHVRAALIHAEVIDG